MNLCLLSAGYDEVVIVANENNKTLLNESSTDDELSIIPTVENSDTSFNFVQSNGHGLKLDESEVLIINPSIPGELDESTDDFSAINKHGYEFMRDSFDFIFDLIVCSADDLDQTHVSVVTVGDGGDELVKDSSSCSSSLTHHGDAASDISSVAQSSSGKSENGESEP